MLYPPGQDVAAADVLPYVTLCASIYTFPVVIAVHAPFAVVTRLPAAHDAVHPLIFAAAPPLR